MSDRAPSDCLLRSWMLRNIHEQKGLSGSGVQNVVTGRINGVAALTEFSHKKCLGVLPRQKKVAVITR